MMPDALFTSLFGPTVLQPLIGSSLCFCAIGQ